MPFSKIDPDKFTLTDVRKMQSAFDAVCAVMNLVERDPRRVKLASIIIRLSTDGEMENLIERAILALR